MARVSSNPRLYNGLSIKLRSINSITFVNRDYNKVAEYKANIPINNLVFRLLAR